MYWAQPGAENTEATVEAAVSSALKLGLDWIVVASNEGDTAFKLLDQPGVDDLNIICVTHHIGFRKDGYDEMAAKTREQLEDRGVRIYTGTHLLAGVDRSLRKTYGGLYPPEVIANTLRMFGEGFKVCLEISVMALDAGLIPFDTRIIAIGGTGRGADTAAVIKPGHSNKIFSSKIGEIICRPDRTS